MRETAGCVGKLAYPNRSAAETAKRHLFGRPGFKLDGRMNTYHCPNCGGFHLGRDKRTGPNVTKHNERRSRESLSKLKRYLELTKVQK